MAKALGIIAEYDPFHLGHEYHLKQAREMTGADLCVSVISGYFTQRGEPALTDKWSRAEMAVSSGVDLVVEMPFVFACNNAGYFAEGGVRILEALGADYIAFGSETADTSRLVETARIRTSMTEKDQDKIRELVKDGLSFPRAQSLVLGEKDTFGPNDSLAIEYIMRMEKAEPIAVKREGVAHDQDGERGSFASASYIRRRLLQGAPFEDVSHLVPKTTLDILKREFDASGFASCDMLYDMLLGKALSTSREELNKVFGAEEGLGSKLKDGFRYASDYEGLIDLLKSKRYTRTRIQRVLVHFLSGLTREKMKTMKPYIRVLAFNEKGARHLKELKKSGDMKLPVVENIKSDMRFFADLRDTLELDIMAADIYNTALKRDLYLNSEFVKKPLKLQAD